MKTFINIQFSDKIIKHTEMRHTWCFRLIIEVKYIFSKDFINFVLF